MYSDDELCYMAQCRSNIHELDSNYVPPVKRHCQSASNNEAVENNRETLNDIYRKPCKFQKAFRLTSTNVCKEAVEVILQDSLEGLGVLAEYKTNKFLTPSSRDTLTRLIINRCSLTLDDPEKRLRIIISSTSRFFKEVSRAIAALMPNENEDIYFIAPHTADNNTKNAKGKLPDRWKNVRFLLKRQNVIPTNTKKTPTSLISSVSSDDDVKCRVKWLIENREPWSDVKNHWEATYAYRTSSCLLRRSMTEVLNTEWPILKSPLGPKLVELDFKKRYPESNLAFEKKWETFFNCLYTLRKSKIRNGLGYPLTEKYGSLSELDLTNADGIRLLLLPYLVPTTSQVKTNCGMKKPSVAESLHGFLIWTKTRQEIHPAIERRNERYRSWQEPSQPCIVLVAEDIAFVSAVYVSLDDQLWRLTSPTQALDMLFKLHITFNLPFPKDCEHLWLLLQQYIYGIRTKFDKYFPVVEGIMASLDHQVNK